MQQRREAEKLKEKSSMAPTASPFCQEGKIDVDLCKPPWVTMVPA